MEAITQILTGALGPFGPVIAVGAVGLVLVLATVVFMLKQRDDPLDKLKKVENEKAQSKENRKEKLRRASSNEKLAKYKSFLEPQNEEELSSLRLKLMQAGYQSRDAVRAFHLAQMLLGVVGLVFGVLYFMFIKGPEGATTQDTLMYILGPGAAGYLLPKYWVTRRVETRKEEITAGFPDSLDMMLVCVEAGQSLDQSINRVAGELRASYPALADEFQIVAYEMKAGKDKSQVLGDMGERCGVQDVSSFVTVLIQSASFGTSISDALRVYAGEMRDKRVMRAEEAANKLPTKMTLATMMLTVPPLLIILIGPSIHNVTQMGQ
ncbi:type II secretion system F family protein [Shimia thalassica]|uniref:type II secretion system F family protein n=1 Tax=Shimia thalassica TaxID=1715693 RepID=UPI000C06F3D2|nr:type II secretion system F family protein [Shimia thalassica]PHO05785.1 pilus assembly protein TadC [Rhodobacteraceae bacterium 4F10]MBU2942707.1 type II secretion system F family protein [Shimia thalassica]MDO6480216.1 type II secretion system F family protein [Shimia thalassica]MDO6502525.1 type II secretion system F family protein [Shimia thalassica]MDO6520633.1 type II secretion system F family protein [Shimia thalassica]